MRDITIRRIYVCYFLAVAVGAMSGHTGASTEPQLQFEVLACEGEPVVLTPAPPSMRAAMEGETYKAM